MNHTTTTIASNVEVVTKVFSWSDKSKSGSAASGNEKQKREPPPQQQQSKVFPCPECGVLIKNKRYNLKRHIQVVHQKERKFECTVPSCGQRFQTKTNLKRHVSTVHKGQRVVQEKEKRVEQEQQESRQTMQQAAVPDSLFNIYNDVNVVQQTLPTTLFHAHNNGNAEQQEQMLQQAMVDSTLNPRNEREVDQASV